MKNNILFLILGGVIVLLLMQTCRPEPKQGTLISKEIEIKHDTIKITAFKDRLITKHVTRWQKQKDSLQTIFVDLPCTKKDSVYSQTIEPKMFQWQTSDDNLIANIKGITTGEVKHIELDYIIKPEKPKNFSLSVGASPDLSILKAGVGYKNVEVDYLRINNVNNIVVGYRIKL
jgi:sporulation protein YlmC with PRC-barrel domain